MRWINKQLLVAAAAFACVLVGSLSARANNITVTITDSDGHSSGPLIVNDIVSTGTPGSYAFSFSSATFDFTGISGNVITNDASGGNGFASVDLQYSARAKALGKTLTVDVVDSNFVTSGGALFVNTILGGSGSSTTDVGDSKGKVTAGTSTTVDTGPVTADGSRNFNGSASGSFVGAPGTLTLEETLSDTAQSTGRNVNPEGMLTAATPEPASMVLAATGLLFAGCGAFFRRNRKKA